MLRWGLVLGLALSFLPPSLKGGEAAAPAAPAAAPKGGGTITGDVTSRPKRYGRYCVVFLTGLEGTFPPKDRKMDQKDLVFIPHVVPVVVGSKVDYLNSDNVLHNVNSPNYERYNLGQWPKGEVRSYRYAKLDPGQDYRAYVQLCNVHPEMEAFVLVLRNPHFTLLECRVTLTRVKQEYLDDPAARAALVAALVKETRKPKTEVEALLGKLPAVILPKIPRDAAEWTQRRLHEHGATASIKDLYTFTLRNVPAGRYKLICWAPKLRPQEIPVRVEAGGTQEVHFKLRRR